MNQKKYFTMEGLLSIMLLLLLIGLPLMTSGCSSSTSNDSSGIVTITVSPTDPFLQVGDAVDFTCTATASDNGTSDITDDVLWTSSDEAVAVIDETGHAIATGGGTTTISAYFAVTAMTATTTLTVTRMGALEGTVTDAITGFPIEGATITITENRATTQTDFEGYYSFNSIPEGSQTITATMTGYANYTSTVEVVANELRTKDIQMSFFSGQVSGMVTDQDRLTPITGALVTIGTVSTITDSMGIYSFDGIAPGEQTITAIADYYPAYSETITVMENEPLVHDIPLQINRIFVTEYWPTGAIYNLVALRADDYSTVGKVAVGSMPNGICISPDGNLVYVANYSDQNFSVVDTTDLFDPAEIIPASPLGTNLNRMAVSPDGSHIYAASSSVNVFDINTADNSITPINVGISTNGIAISPDGSRIYAGAGANLIYFDVATPTTVVPVADASFSGITEMVFSPDGSELYVANSSGPGGTVSVVDTLTNTVTDVVTVGGQPYGVAVTPDGLWILVATYTGTSSITVIDSTTLDTFNVPTGTTPFDIAITTDGTHAYVTNLVIGSTQKVDTVTDIRISDWSTRTISGFIRPKMITVSP